MHSGFDPKYKPALDSLQAQLSEQINTTSDKYITNPLVGKDDLVHQKLTLEISRDLAKYSAQSIDRALDDLNAMYKRLASFDATVKNLRI